MGAAGQYLVAVSRSLDGEALSGVRAIHDSAVRVVACEGLQAIVCDVDLDEFGEEPLRGNLENLAWVEEMARAHHAAVCAVDAVATTVPMRFATIYESDDRVAEQLRALREPLAEALDRIEGAAEWSVKAYAAPDPHEVADQPRAESGAAYLAQRREAVEARRRRESDDEESLSAFHHELTRLAVASRRLLPQDPRLSGRQEPMRMNAAYLVAHDAAERFAECATTALADRPELRVEIDGPWPPYSFASLEPS
jgi:hypothetical protein